MAVGARGSLVARKWSWDRHLHTGPPTHLTPPVPEPPRTEPPRTKHLRIKSFGLRLERFMRGGLSGNPVIVISHEPFLSKYFGICACLNLYYDCYGLRIPWICSTCSILYVLYCMNIIYIQYYMDTVSIKWMGGYVTHIPQLSVLIYTYFLPYLIWYDMIWYDMIWSDLIWSDLIWSDLIWSDLMWSDVIWCDQIWSDPIWSDLI